MYDEHDGFECEYEQISGHLEEPEWLDRVVYESDGSGKPYIYERGELIVTRSTLDRFRALVGETGAELALFADLVLLRGVANAAAKARAIRLEGGMAQPNHVFFADGGRPSPVNANPVVLGSGVSFGNPFTFGTGVSFGNPFTVGSGVSFGNPFAGGGPFGGGGGCCADCHGTYQAPVNPDEVPRRTLALAAPAPPPSVVSGSVGAGLRVLVIDTGLAHHHYRPDFVGDVNPRDADDVDLPDTDGDDSVDTAAGHGTFIAGIIERMAPSAVVRVERMLTTFGVGDDAVIGQLIDAIPVKSLPNIFNLSFSSYTEDDQPPYAITRAIQRLTAKGDARRAIEPEFQGPIVVASAGNSALCRRAWPAALPEVISVGALAPTGPAWFTNFGPWVKACAPGVDIVSRFFRRDTDVSPLPKPIPDDDGGRAFRGWASWSGTSFSAPIVVGALLQRQAAGGTLDDAVRALIHEPHLARMPGLGTIVNVYP